jgi:hypothetical protein
MNVELLFEIQMFRLLFVYFIVIALDMIGCEIKHRNRLVIKMYCG